jgi:cell division protein FtsB
VSWLRRGEKENVRRRRSSDKKAEVNGQRPGSSRVKLRRAQVSNASGAESPLTGRQDKAENKLRKKSRRSGGAFRFLKTVGFLIVAGYACHTLISQEITYSSLRSEKARLEAEMEAALSNREVLKKRIDALNTDEYIEKVAREQLGLVKPGEVPYVIQETGEKETDDAGER